MVFSFVRYKNPHFFAAHRVIHETNELSKLILSTINQVISHNRNFFKNKIGMPYGTKHFFQFSISWQERLLESNRIFKQK